MRTVLCSGCRGGGALPAQRGGEGVCKGGCLPEGCVFQHAPGKGGVYPSMHWAGGMSVDRILDTCLWKQYLSTTTLRTVKIRPVLKNLKIIKYITGKIIGQQTELFEFNQRDVFPVRDFALSEGWQARRFGINNLSVFTQGGAQPVCLHTRGSSTCLSSHKGELNLSVFTQGGAQPVCLHTRGSSTCLSSHKGELNLSVFTPGGAQPVKKEKIARERVDSRWIRKGQILIQTETWVVFRLTFILFGVIVPRRQFSKFYLFEGDTKFWHCFTMWRTRLSLQPENEVWGKVMFLHLCVILFRVGLASQHASQVTLPGESGSGGSASRGGGDLHPGEGLGRHPPCSNTGYGQ